MGWHQFHLGGAWGAHPKPPPLPLQWGEVGWVKNEKFANTHFAHFAHVHCACSLGEARPQ